MPYLKWSKEICSMNSSNILIKPSSPEYHHFILSSLQEITVIISTTKSSKFKVDFMGRQPVQRNSFQEATTGQHSERKVFWSHSPEPSSHSAVQSRRKAQSTPAKCPAHWVTCPHPTQRYQPPAPPQAPGL